MRWTLSGTAVLLFSLGTVVGVAWATRDAEADWPSFTGAVLGAALTVLGALIILEVQQSRESRQARMLLIDQLREITQQARALRQAPPDTDAERLIAAEQLASAVVRLRNTRQFVTPDSASMVSAYFDIGSMPSTFHTTTMTSGSDKVATTLDTGQVAMAEEIAIATFEKLRRRR
jgi:hypothetical protein